MRGERRRRGELALRGDGAAEIPERDPIDELCVRIRARGVERERTQFLRCRQLLEAGRRLEPGDDEGQAGRHRAVQGVAGGDGGR